MQEQERGREERFEGQNDRHYRRSDGDDAMRRERERDRERGRYESGRYEGGRSETGGEWEPEWERHRPDWQQPARISGQRRDQEFGTQQGPPRGHSGEGSQGEWGQQGRGRSAQWRDDERGASYSTGQGAYGEGPSRYGQWQGGYGQRSQSAGEPQRYGEQQGGYGGAYGQTAGYYGYGSEFGQRSRGYEPEGGWRPEGFSRRSAQGGGTFGVEPQQPERFGERFEGPHSGRGPKGYTRSKERILDDVNQALQDDSWVDASEIDVQCDAGEVVLRGTVSSRQDKRRAEECAERIAGVKDVRNEIRVRSEQESATQKSSAKAQSGSGRTTSANPT